jgi:Bacterial membrane protein YfhO
MQSVLEVSLAILAGLGLEIVLRRWRTRSVRLALTLSSLVVAAVIAELWTKVGSARLTPAEAAVAATSKTAPSVAMLESLRRSSLIWPTASIALVLVLVALAWALRRSPDRRARTMARGAGLALLGAQSAFLLFAGVGISSYFHQAFPVTPAVTALQRIVGTNLVGFDSGNTSCVPSETRAGFCGVRLWVGNGFYPEMNIGYGVDELGLHDPLIPQAYFDAWPVPNAMQITPANLNLFVPNVDTVALARRYGVSYVLALPGQPVPAGMRRVAMLAGETLYSVPGSGRFAFASSSTASSSPRVLSSSHPGDARYVVKVATPRAAKLLVRITDVTGWHATANGKAVAIKRSAGDLMSVEVPAGTHTVVLHYWPKRFTEGIVLAVIALLALAVWAGVLAVFRRRGAPNLLRRRSLH